MVEHDEMMMREADHIIDMGPFASHLGGEVVAEGDYDAIISNPMSLTGKYLNGEYSIEPPKTVRKMESFNYSGRSKATQSKKYNCSVSIECAVCG